MCSIFKSCFPFGIFYKPPVCNNPDHKKERTISDVKNLLYPSLTRYLHKNEKVAYSFVPQIDIECTICRKQITYCSWCKSPDKFICKHMKKLDCHEQYIRFIRSEMRTQEHVFREEAEKALCHTCGTRQKFVIHYTQPLKYETPFNTGHTSSVCEYCYSSGKLCKGCLYNKPDLKRGYCYDCDIHKCKYCGTRDNQIHISTIKHNDTYFSACTNCIKIHLCNVGNYEGVKCCSEKMRGNDTCEKHKNSYMNMCIFCKSNESLSYSKVCMKCAKDKLPRSCSLCLKTESECNRTDNKAIKYFRSIICNKCGHSHKNNVCDTKVAVYYSQKKTRYITQRTTTTHYSNGFNGLPITTYEESDPLINTTSQDVLCKCNEPYSEEYIICHHSFTSFDNTGYEKNEK